MIIWVPFGKDPITWLIIIITIFHGSYYLGQHQNDHLGPLATIFQIFHTPRQSHFFLFIAALKYHFFCPDQPLGPLAAIFPIFLPPRQRHFFLFNAALKYHFFCPHRHLGPLASVFPSFHPPRQIHLFLYTAALKYHFLSPDRPLGPLATVFRRQLLQITIIIQCIWDGWRVGRETP